MKIRQTIPALILLPSVLMAGLYHHGEVFAGTQIPTLQITEDNAVAVAAEAVNTIGIVGRFMFDSLFTIIVNPYSSSENTKLHLYHEPQTRDCHSAGTMKITSDIDGVNLVTGDSVSAAFDACDDGYSVVISGTLHVTVQEHYTFDSGPPYSYIFLVSWIDYSETLYGDERVINGMATLRESTLDNVIFDGNITGSSLSYTESSGSRINLNNFWVTKVIDTHTESYGYHSSGTLDSTDLGGSIQYSTTEPLTGYTLFPPSSGVMEITGHQSSEVMNVVDSFDLIIEYDAGDDGFVDKTIQSTWDKF